MTQQDQPEGLARDLADVARQLHDQSSVTETWQRVIELVVAKIDACEVASVSIVHSDGRVQSAVATDDVARRVDALQYETGEGPCLEAIRDHELFETADLRAETRWPEFTRRAESETGIRSVLSFQLFVQQDTLGALNMYSREPSAWDEHDRTTGALFAAHAALAVSNAQEREHHDQLEHALQSSRTIGLALGMLMEQRNVDRRTAFAILSGASQRANVKLRDLAEQLVAGHEKRASP